MKLNQAATASLADAQAHVQAKITAASATSPLSQTVAKLHARLHEQVGQVDTQLSHFGKWKATVADMQASARAIRDTSPRSPAADIKTAAVQLATRLNAAIGAAKLAASSSGAAQTGEALRNAIASSGSARDALKTLGFKQLTDGTVAFNAALFDARQRSAPQNTLAALSTMGQVLEAAATAELAQGTDTSGPIAALSEQANALKAKKFMVLALGVPFTIDHASPSTNQVSEGLSAYKANG